MAALAASLPAWGGLVPLAAAASSAGTVLAWGANNRGQVGDGTTTDRLTPVQVSGLGPGSGVVAIAGGYTSAYVLKSDGTVQAWGNNTQGQLGDGTTTSFRWTPVQVAGLGPGSGVVAIASQAAGSYVLKSDGTVLAWGDNDPYGQIGDGTTTNRLTPVQVAGLGPGSGVVAISGGALTGYALKSDGTVMAWGDNSEGQAGDGTTTNRLTPVQVAGLGPGSGVVAIAGGGRTGYALKSDGTVMAWGLGSEGQIGSGSTGGVTNSWLEPAPVQVSGLGPGSGVVAIAGGFSNGYALKSDRTVLAWGLNSGGQVGDGTTQYKRSAPVQVSGLGPGSGVVAITGGHDTGYALKSDGTVMAWGANVGDGTGIGSFAPVQVSGLGPGSGVVAITGGGGTSYALKSDGTPPLSPPPPDPRRIVALGDSYSSGEGAPDPIAGFLPGTNTATDHCHRSSLAYGLVAPVPTAPTSSLVACSGAVINDYYMTNQNNPSERAQQTAFGSDPVATPATDVKAVTVTMGGNDVGFGSVLAYCVAAVSCQDTYKAMAGGRGTDAIDINIRALYRSLVQFYKQVRHDSGNGKAPVFVLAYPQIFHQASLGDGPCNGIDDGEQNWIRDKWSEFNQWALIAAQAAGVHFIAGTEDAFVGHTLCTGPLNQQDANGLIPANQSWSFHPNVNGHAELARLVAAHINANPIAANPDQPNVPPPRPPTLVRRFSFSGRSWVSTAPPSTSPPARRETVRIEAPSRSKSQGGRQARSSTGCGTRARSMRAT